MLTCESVRIRRYNIYIWILSDSLTIHELIYDNYYFLSNYIWTIYYYILIYLYIINDITLIIILLNLWTGLLDFEYATYDWRAMELAVCLSKYAGEKDPLPYFELFLTGFSKYGILSEKEIELIPDLIVLRILSNVVFFVGRTVTGYLIIYLTFILSSYIN